jgi:adenosylmethionine-8-amino-7-oxononanoate aminotransferase
MTVAQFTGGRRQRPPAFWAPASGLAPLEVAQARGSWVEDVDGRRYLEGSSGVLNLNIGHCHPQVVSAIGHQLQTVTYAHPIAFTIEGRERLAERLLRFLGLEDYCVVFLGSGTDAVECACLLAKQYHHELGAGRRKKIVSRQMSFHGCSEACLSLSGHRRRRRVFPFLSPISTVPAPYCFRCPMGLTPDSCGCACLDPLRDLLASDDLNETAAVIVEPIGGAAGAGISPPDGYYPALRDLCDQHGTLLISDEVLCGMGRSGAAMAMSAWNCLPDILVLGKGLGAGYADISAVVVSDRIRAAIESNSRLTPLIHTYAGNPLAVAGANAVLDVYESEQLVDRVPGLAATIFGRLQELRRSYPAILDIRGRGLLIGIELSPSKTAATRSSTTEFLRIARQHGLLLYPCNGFLPGESGDGFFIAPPLNILDHELEHLLDAVGKTLAAVTPGLE